MKMAATLCGMDVPRWDSQKSFLALFIIRRVSLSSVVASNIRIIYGWTFSCTLWFLLFPF